MQDNLDKKINKTISRHRKAGLRRSITAVLSMITVVITLSVLILPALTMESTTGNSGDENHAIISTEENVTRVITDENTIGIGNEKNTDETAAEDCSKTSQDTGALEAPPFESMNTESIVEVAENNTIETTDETINAEMAAAKAPEPFSGGFFAMPAPDYIGDYLNQDGSKWQITKEEYLGNTQNYKKPVDSDGDGKPDIFIQKNVIPTEIENEFLVYLSIDVKESWVELFNDAHIALTTANSYANDPTGSVYRVIHGNTSADLAPSGEQGSYTRQYYVNIRVFQDHNSATPIISYYDWRYGNTSNCKNATGFLYMSQIGYIAVAKSINLNPNGNGVSNPFVIDIFISDFQTNMDSQQTILRSVEDELGEHIDFVEFVDGDGDWSITGNTITWNPQENVNVTPTYESTPLSAWYYNVSQLVYKVRLNVLSPGFVSCADNLNSAAQSIADGESFKVNNWAELTYDRESDSGLLPSQTGMTAQFPIPEVRGLLYDITFLKQNESGKMLEGAVFGLYESDGTTPILVNGAPYILTTSPTDVNRFFNLPWGSYVVKELTAPKHYTADTNITWPIEVCYTTNMRSNLVEDVSPFEKNLRYSGNDTPGCALEDFSSMWKITNYRKTFLYAVEIIKVDEFGNRLKDAVFEASNPGNPGQFISGVTDEDGTCSFSDQYRSNTEYVLKEIQAPDGYHSIGKDILFKIAEDVDEDTFEGVFINENDFGGDVTMEYLEEEIDGVDYYRLVFTVLNKTGYRLPETGGMGTKILIICGSMIMICVMFIGISLVARREGRGKY